MAEKTIIELKKLFLVISKQYQEYKKVVAQLKHLLNERGNTIMRNKKEIFSLRKDGYSGPPEDEEFFKICHTIQRRLLESHTEAYYKDFNSFEKCIEKKLRMMDTELERLQRIGILWDEKQNPVQNMSKIIKKKEVEIMALKQEMCQLFKQKQQDRIQINTLEQESKPTTDKILLLKQTYEKERSTRRQIFEQLRQATGDCRDLDVKLKTALEENNGLQEKYQQESTLHKTTKDTMKRLQRQLRQMVQEKNCVQSKYEKHKTENKVMKEASDKTIEELQLQVKETVKEHKRLEKNYEKEKSSHNNTKEAFNKVMEELQGQLNQVVQENKDLEEIYKKQIFTTTEELEQTKKELINNSEIQVAKCEELQVQMQNIMKENKTLEENYQQKKSQHKKTKDELAQRIKERQTQLKQLNDQDKVTCNTIEQLEVNPGQGEEKIISIEETYLKQVDNHGITKDMLSQTAEKFQDKINQESEGNQNFEEKYENEKSSHKETREELVQANQQNKENSAKIKELEKYVTEMSMLQPQLQRTLEELDQAKCESKILKEKLEEIGQLRGHGQNYEDLQVPQPQTKDKQFKEDLHACLSVISDTETFKQRFIAMKRRYLDKEQLQISEIVEQVYKPENKDLMKRLCGYQNLLKVKSDTISRLEQQLSTLVQQCDEREKKYVKMLNCRLVKEHQLKKELEKVSKPIPQRISSWWQEKVLKSIIFDTSQDEEELNLYPADWRLPKFPRL